MNDNDEDLCCINWQYANQIKFFKRKYTPPKLTILDTKQTNGGYMGWVESNADDPNNDKS